MTFQSVTSNNVLVFLNRLMHYGFSDEQLPNAPWFIKNLFFNWLFWFIYHQLFVLMDFIFRKLNETYSHRSLSLFHFFLMQLGYTFTTSVVVFFGLLFYVRFKFKLPRDFQIKLNVDVNKSSYFDIDQQLNGLLTIRILWIVSFSIVMFPVVSLFFQGLPSYFPNITLSWVAEAIIRFSALFPSFIDLYLLLMVFLIIRFLTNVPEKLDCNSVTTELTKMKKNPIFSFISNYLAGLVSAIIVICIQYSVLNLLYTLFFDKNYELAALVSSIFLVVSFISLIFFFYPMSKYRRFIKYCKEKKLLILLEKKNELIFDKLSEIEEAEVDEKLVGKLQLYNFLITELESIQERPFNFMGFFIGMLTSLIFEIIISVISQYAFNILF